MTEPSHDLTKPEPPQRIPVHPWPSDEDDLSQSPFSPVEPAPNKNKTSKEQVPTCPS